MKKLIFILIALMVAVGAGAAIAAEQQPPPGGEGVGQEGQCLLNGRCDRAQGRVVLI